MTQGQRSQIVNSVETGMSEGRKVIRRGIKLVINVVEIIILDLSVRNHVKEIVQQ